MMDFSISKEAFVFLCSLAGGSLIFLVYDLFRVIRHNARGGVFFLHVQDAIFWLIAFTIMFFVIFTVNNGTVRFYEILGAVLGAVLYGVFLSDWVLRLINYLISIFSKIFKVFLKILLTPLFFAYNILYRYMYLIFRPFWRFWRFVLRRLTETVKRTGRMIKKK